ncbi:hypothetical protein PP175_17670 [Aneurinibacillus sp. Ricciae_BoGa-3]|uniref:hypothetical protein n=1 Tax=Aneurinibacillus sp. Ricciae_BoGa-3 TaxID=3022697 RepID=UPI00233FB290|nr:hypothetical protein [Aneurinibacillus sp. Ricciae_BoGa-3]WCK53219.1 hypothetical protein PP175_17670 [Aneurinibacillus sp. Ricciae_BoGa-3]
MITLNEVGTLEICNEHGLLSINNELENGISITYYRDDIGLSLVGLYSINEIKEFLRNERSHLISSSRQTKLAGKKKVLQTFFSKVNSLTGEEGNYRVILYAEGFMYQFLMAKEEWNEMVLLMTRGVNGDNTMKITMPLEK